MTDPADRRHFPGRRWGALRWAPFLFFVLLLSPWVASAQDAGRETDSQHSRLEAPACTASDPSATDLASSPLILAVRDAGRELLLLDGTTLAVLGRCQLPYALEGTPVRSPQGRYVYAAAAGGWVLRLDLQHFGSLLGTRTGLALSGLVLSADGRWLLAGHAQPHRLILLDAGLNVVRRYRTSALAGGADSAVSGVWLAQARKSFVVAFDTLPELWELSYDPAAEPIHDGLVHDYRMGEAIATAGFLGVRRTPLPHPLHVVLADAPLRHLLAIASPGPPGPDARSGTELEIINLDIRRRISARALTGYPVAGAGVAFTSGSRPWLALPTGPEGRVVLIETMGWTLHPEGLASLRGVDAVRSHPATPQLWLHTTEATPSDTLVLMDKDDWRVTATLREAGRRWLPVSFSAGGRQAVLATHGTQGEIRLLDTRTLRELRRVALAQVEAVFALDGPAPDALQK